MKKHQNLFRDLQEDFRKMKKNLLVAQSGGPTAAINATLAGVIKQAIKEEQSSGEQTDLNGNGQIENHR